MKDYKTYAWLGAAIIVNDDLGLWEPSGLDADAEVQSLVNAELTSNKLTIDNTNPELLVAYVAGVDVDEVFAIEGNPDEVEVDIANIPMGALVIGLIDAETGYLVWVSEATADIQSNPPVELAKKRLDHAVKKMLKTMPK